MDGSYIDGIALYASKSRLVECISGRVRKAYQLLVHSLKMVHKHYQARFQSNFRSIERWSSRYNFQRKDSLTQLTSPGHVGLKLVFGREDNPC